MLRQRDSGMCYCESTSSVGEKMDEAGKLRKKIGQPGKKDVGKAGREGGIKGEEDKKWKLTNGEKDIVSRGGRAGRGQWG